MAAAVEDTLAIMRRNSRCITRPPTVPSTSSSSSDHSSAEVSSVRSGRALLDVAAISRRSPSGRSNRRTLAIETMPARWMRSS